jgi:GTP-dependent phosphoenolpyruvate carboxykinase
MRYKGPHGEIVSSNGSEAGDAFVRGYMLLVKEHQERQAEWVAALRAQGVKAAHPNDGWNDRMQQIIHFSYPQFDDGVQVGDVIAVGRPDEYTLCKVTEIVKKRGLLLLSEYVSYRWEVLDPC